MSYEQFKPLTREKFPVANVAEGRIEFNGECVRRYFSKANYLALYFDKTARKIGMKPIAEITFGAAKLTKIPGTETRSPKAVVSVGRFMSHYGIKACERGQYPVMYNSGLEVLEIALAKREFYPPYPKKKRKKKMHHRAPCPIWDGGSDGPVDELFGGTPCEPSILGKDTTG